MLPITSLLIISGLEYGAYRQLADLGGSQFGDNPLMSISAMMFDSFRGLLVNNPIMIFIFLGLPLWFKKNRQSLILTVLATVPSIIVLSLFFQWNGGDAPLGRYLIDILPLYIPALAFAIEALKESWQRMLLSLTAVVTFIITINATFKKFPLVDPGAQQICKDHRFLSRSSNIQV